MYIPTLHTYVLGTSAVPICSRKPLGAEISVPMYSTPINKSVNTILTHRVPSPGSRSGSMA